VVAADLRGYGASSKPEGGADHAGYSKRAVAQDQVEMMQRLGFERFFLAGHDRGGRVGHRMALDHPGRVITGSLRREDNEKENIPIRRGIANLPDGWKPGEMLVIISDNPERYGNPHYKPCPLPKSNLIQIPTRAWAAAFVDFGRDHN
jgi:hypothetical protein